MKSITILSAILLFLTVSCRQNQQNTTTKEEKSPIETSNIQIFNFDIESDRLAYQKLELDKTHPNLLNPKISEGALAEVRTSWGNLHQNIGAYLVEKGFSWEVPDSTITIVQKFYFTPEGRIKSYFYNIRNENVSPTTKQQFGKHISGFAKEHSIAITRDAAFAQCGKTRYLN